MPHLKLQGRRIHYQWHGNYAEGRDTVIFLHDGLGAIGSWKELPATIAKRLGVNALVYDRYGYGLSQPRRSFPYGFIDAEVEPLLELLERLALPRAHLVGHSDGGSIALLFAARYPERVQSLVTEAAHTFVEDETRAGIQALADAQAAGKTPGWLKKLHGARAEEVLRAWCKSWLSSRHRHWNIEDWLGFVKAPTLAIQGEHDDFGSKAQVTAIMNRVEGCETWLVEGCGHTPHTEAGDEFLERVSAFLARHAAR